MFPSPFPEPAAEPVLRFAFAEADLPQLRAAVARAAQDAGLGAARLPDFVLCAHELAANSVMHAGGSGLLRLWAHGGELVCEVSDHGVFADPEAGRSRPNLSATGGAGLWIVRQACDAVQIRTVAGQGTAVRMRMTLEPGPEPDPEPEQVHAGARAQGADAAG
jgi:anti-sigma regulatory factor (Ser/Thr protein kinase)